MPRTQAGGPPPPTDQPARQALPDQLRGLALLGIAVVNMPFLAISAGGFTAASTESLPDRIAAFAIVAFAQGKFYLLFSFLFGYSLTLQLRRTGALGPYRRRLAGLAVLGVAHATLFFIGDILLSYAVLGLALLAFVRRSDRAALWAAGVAGAIGLTVLTLLALAPPMDSGGAGIVADPGVLNGAILGSFADAVGGRVAELPNALIVQAVLNWSFALAMFLLGLVAGRRGVLAAPQRFSRLWRRLLIVAGVVGLPGGLLSAWLTVGPGGGGQGDVVGVAIGFATAPALTGGYVALAALTTQRRAMRVFEPAGRMSLTGYLGESILMSAIFCGWGFGLFGRPGALIGALTAALVWGVLDLGSGWWLRRHRYGPFEWLLRAWSYGRRPGRAEPASSGERSRPEPTGSQPAAVPPPP